MDMHFFTLFMKLLREDYKLSEEEISRISRRLMSDEREFSNVWKLYQERAKNPKSGVDEFKPILNELLA